jgi:hypothetical protein
MLIGRWNNIEPNIIDHHIAANSTTQNLIGILSKRHTSKHASLKRKSISLGEGISSAPNVVHEEWALLRRVYEQILMWNRKNSIKAIHYIAIFRVIQWL